MPEALSRELIKQEPWLAEHRQKSVTELEIIHGVLNNPTMANRASFYFRDPAHVQKVPTEQSDDFTEQDPHAQWKLAALKDRIRESAVDVREDYPNPKELGQMVLQDLTAAIDDEFPPETVPDPLDIEAAEHEAFAQSRAGIYIGRQEHFERLDSHANGDGPALVILGESGLGKSALLANWALKYRQLHPDELLIMHFIGASSYSADWAAMLRRIMGEFKRHFDIQQDIPAEPEELRRTFANWLQAAAARGRTVLILDALNQLEDLDQAPDLAWLPPVIPGDVRLIVSTLPGRPLEAIERRDWPSLQVRMLEVEERRQLIEEYLDQYRKTLSTGRLEKIAITAQTASPLYLRALLEELRLFGEHEHLDDRIDHYLGAASVGPLYERILERYEQDYERERPGLVKDMMSLIWASRRGLSEAELLELLGKGGEPLPRVYLSPLYLACEQSLVAHSGLIGFFHEYFRKAVRSKYLSSKQDQRSSHLQLATYFEAQIARAPRTNEPANQTPPESERQPNILRFKDYLKSTENTLDKVEEPSSQTNSESKQADSVAFSSQFDVSELSTRILDELPWQLAKAESWEQLFDLLADLSFFEACWSSNEFDTRAYWAAIEANSELRMVDAYRCVVDSPEQHSRCVSEIMGLFLYAGHKSEILALVEHFEAAGYSDCTFSRVKGLFLKDRGDLEEAMKLHKQNEKICRQLGDMDGLQQSLGNQASILQDWGRLEEAMKLYKQCEKICRQLGDMDGLQQSLGNEASILQDWGRLEQAMELHIQREQICRELGDRKGVGNSLDDQASILQDWGRLEEAMELYEQQEQISREAGFRAGLQISLRKQSIVLRKLCRFEEAMQLLKQQEYILRESNEKYCLSECLGDQAGILEGMDRLEEAMELLKQQEQICRELGNKDGLQSCFGDQALILEGMDCLEEAMELLKRQEQICRELGDKYGLQSCLGDQAEILEDMDHLEETANGLIKQGHNVSVGSFGNPYKVPLSDSYQPVLADGKLPNVTEQEIIIIDLEQPEIQKKPRGEKYTSDGEDDWWASCNQGVIDPRTRTMLFARGDFDRILSHGGLFVIFAKPRQTQKMKFGHLDSGYGLQGNNINVDNWSFLSCLDDTHVRIEHDSGSEIFTFGKDDLLSKLLAKSVKNSEFLCSLERHYRINEESWIPLLRNKYDSTVSAAISRTCRKDKRTWILIFPQFGNKSDFISELFQLLPTFAPRLFPHYEGNLWLHKQEHELPQVNKLEEKKKAIEQQCDDAIKRIDLQIEKEKEDNKFWYDLIRETGDLLVQAVIRALSLLGFEQIVDVDEEIKTKGDGGSLREDIQINDISPILIVDVKGIADLPSDAEATQAHRHATMRMKEWGKTDINCLTIINHQRNLPPLDRENDKPYRQELLDGASQIDSGLMTAWDLYRLLRSFLRNKWNPENVKPLFYESQRITIIPANYEYVGKVEQVWKEADAFSVIVEESTLESQDTIGIETPIEILEYEIVSLMVNDQEVIETEIGNEAGVKTHQFPSNVKKGFRVYKSKELNKGDN